MAEDAETVRLLRSIDRRLALLSGAEERKLRALLRAELLRTAARAAIFDAIDGRTGSPELAKRAGVTERAAQLFVKELLDLGVVDVPAGSTGRGVIVVRNDEAIVRWYLDRTRDGDAPAAK